MKTRTTTTLPVQAKPHVTQPGDAAEREADRLADAALSPATTTAPLTATRFSAPVMRQVVEEPEFEDDDAYDIAPKARSSTSPAAPGGFMDAIRSNAAGRPLEPAVRARMEHGFGRSLGGVRVHADGESARLSDSIDARAFTHGRDIFFGRGEYAPGSRAGDRLLAHELAHTLQQAPPGQVARKPKDPKQMTDAEKIRERDRLRKLTKDVIARLRAKFDAEKAAAGGRPIVDGAKRASERQVLARAIEGARRIQDPAQRSVRLGYLEAEAKLLDEDDFYAWLVTGAKVVMPGGAKTFAKLGDPSQKLKDNELATFAGSAAAINRGVDAFLIHIYEPAVYEAEKVNLADVATEEASAAEVAGGGLAPRAPGSTTGAFEATDTLEDRELLEELVTALGDLSTGEPATYDQAALLAELRKLDAGARRDFYAYVHAMVKPGTPRDPSAKGLPRLLELFNKLDPASREAMRVNREIKEKQPGATEEALPEAVRLELESDVKEEQQARTDSQQIASDLDRLKGKVMPPEVAKELAAFSFGISPFFNETAMLIGLLAGARERSDAVKDAVGELMLAIVTFRRELLKKMARHAAESAILTGISAATKVGVVFFGWRIRRLLKALQEIKDTIERLQKIYDTAKRIQRVVEILASVRTAAPALLSWYDTATTEYARLQRLMESRDPVEGLDEAIEAKEAELIERLDDRLEGALGVLLEHLYLPEDASADELRQTLLDIPRGLTALEDLWTYYRDPTEQGKPQFANVLAIRGFHAGNLLYPFVGLVSALIATELQGGFSDRKFNFTRNKKILESAGDQGGRRERHRKRFAKLSRKRYEPVPGSLDKPLHAGRAALDAALDRHEPGTPAEEHWTRSWFKKAVRREIKKLNADPKLKSQTYEARPKAGKKSAAGPPERLPIPRYRASLAKPAGNNLAFVIKLNPDELGNPRDELSFDDFKSQKGVEFTGEEDRKEPIRRFLLRKKYHVLPHPAGGTREFIRLHKGLSDTPEHPFLMFEGDRIKAGFDPGAYTAFLGQTIGDDHELPEGYHLQLTDYGVHIQIKHGVAKRAGDTPPRQLYLGPGRVLQEAKPKEPPKIVRPAVIKDPVTEAYEYVGAVDETLAEPKPGAPRFKTQRSRPTWDREIAAQPFLRRRTTAISGVLGYTIRARALGDDLPSKLLPGLREQDDKGHLVARRFTQGDPKDLDPYWNLVPMLTRENQYPGRWYMLEKEIAEHYVGKKGDPTNSVEFGISLIYPGPATRRPRSVTMRWHAKNAQGTSIDGGEKRRTVDND